MSDKSKPATSSWPVWSLLCAVLIVLKLLGKISIGWWLVFAPLWMPIALFVLILGAMLVITVIAALLGDK